MHFELATLVIGLTVVLLDYKEGYEVAPLKVFF